MARLKEDSKSDAMSAWHPPPRVLVLEDDEVHAWRIALNLSASRVEGLWGLLAADEQARAERFHFQKDREHFIVARGTLRRILGRYLNEEPPALRFCHNHYGKPALAEASGGKAFRFNLSHSHGLALLAVTRGREIGIDVEYVRDKVVGEQIAERFFSPREVGVLRALPAHMQQEAFFNCWTRKEAYIKAQGEGLSLPLDRFEVSLAPGEPPALLVTMDDPREASRWSLRELSPGHGYAAALAAEGDDWRLTCWQWQERSDRPDSSWSASHATCLE